MYSSLIEIKMISPTLKHPEMSIVERLPFLSFITSCVVFLCTEIVGAILWPEQKITAIITCVDAIFVAAFAIAISRKEVEGETPLTNADRFCLWFYVWMIWSAGVILPNMISVVLLTEHTIRAIELSVMIIVMAIIPFATAVLAIVISIISCRCTCGRTLPTLPAVA